VTDYSEMKYPGSPERIFLAVTGMFILCGLGCMIVGLVLKDQRVVTVGWWVVVCGIILAFLPLMLLLVVLAIEKLRR
jgi:hypothetical protein